MDPRLSPAFSHISRLENDSTLMEESSDLMNIIEECYGLSNKNDFSCSLCIYKSMREREVRYFFCTIFKNSNLPFRTPG